MVVFWIGLSAISLVTVASCLGLILLTNRRIGQLVDVEPALQVPWPSVTVVIPARNEQRDIEHALESVLALHYERLEVLVINDRSTDDTGPILDRMAAAHGRLRVVHLAELPPGWLGKNHALHFGAARSTSEYVLFTDADVVMHPDTLRQAISYVHHRRLDHLTISPDILVPHVMLGAFVTVFFNVLTIYMRLWRMADPESSAFMGIGAFNLVRREAYCRAGTHLAIAMRPDDDLKLGKIINDHGYRQELLAGAGRLSVRWYASLGELIRGLEKNAFSGVEYRLWRVMGGTAALFALDVWPFIAPWILGGMARWFYLATAAVILLNAWVSARQTGHSLWTVALFPVAILLLIYIQWRSTLLTIFQGGIRWRDTFYSLAELKENKV